MKKTSILFFVLLMYTASSAQTIPTPTGPWSVGRVLTELIDSSRTGAGDLSQFRTIPLMIWYPVKKTENIAPAYPLPELWRKEQGKYLAKKVGTLASEFLQNLKVWSIPDAPLNDKSEKFPLLIFGPGYTWLPTDYSTIIENIVSHGYVVAGYVPTGFPGVTLVGGKIIPGTLTVHQQDISFEDAGFVLKNLSQLNTNLLNGIADTGSIGFFGHSQGGIASVFTAGNNAAIKVVVNLDGDLMGSALQVKLIQPAMLLSNDERIGMNSAAEKMDREGRERSDYRRHADWVRATDDNKISVRIRINGIRHLNFNDLGLIPTGIMTDAEKKDKLGYLDGEKGLRIITDITRMFFDFILKGKYFPTLVELEEIFPDAQGILWKGVEYYKKPE